MVNHCLKESEVYFEREIPVHWGLVLSRIFVFYNWYDN